MQFDFDAVFLSLKEPHRLLVRQKATKGGLRSGRVRRQAAGRAGRQPTDNAQARGVRSGKWKVDMQKRMDGKQALFGRETFSCVSS